ncbi:C40 family peptidase [Paenirhodobacter populi]|uniref:hypothetical protein n=1 Tax=Paenirhodobacter populi TaxID=2306993 RepID=UPI000FE2AA22|nr:hypothetical protein [Sinirhodobacter populi]RWR09702.1 hypothetical protein D2T32_04990 [Sinirhodobacter populi]
MSDRAGMVNPALVLAHARAWIGTPYVRCAALRGRGADCVGLLRGIAGELSAEVHRAQAWRDDWALTDILETGLRARMVSVPSAAAGPGIVAAYRVGPDRVAHVGVLSEPGALVHVSDYGTRRVVEDRWPVTGRRVSSLWGFRLPEGCERGPDGITPDDCLAVICPSGDGRVYAEISLMIDGTSLARSVPFLCVEAALERLAPIYPHIETVE